MKWFQWFKAKKSDAVAEHLPSSSEHQTCGCQTEELTDFIKNFVVAETLDPAVKNSVHHIGDCNCEHGDAHNITMTNEVIDSVLTKTKANIPQLELLLAGHKAWCRELEHNMRQGKISQYNLAKVGSELWCCIGQWLKCESHALHHYHEYQNLLVSYQEFRQCATKMLDNHQKGYLMDAIVMLRGDFASQSVRVQNDLQTLVQKVHQETWLAENDEDVSIKVA